MSTGAAEDVLYITDRAADNAPDGALTYGSARSKSVSFGSVELRGDQSLAVVKVTQDGTFPPTPFAIQRISTGVRRDPAALAAYAKAAATLQFEIAARLAKTKRKEVVIFTHGYANTFDDAVQSTGEICRALSDDFVCIALTWPAAGKGGAFMGYNIDRESGEFAVADLKRMIRVISETKGLERVHLIAHSRGTDIITSVMQQLGIEAYTSRSSISQKFKIYNLVLFAPDIDIDVASSKLFIAASDPDLPFGGKPSPAAVLPESNFHLTIYSSPNDKALGLSTRLFGSSRRLGQLSIAKPISSGMTFSPEAAQFAGLADFIEFNGKADFFGHGYFLTNKTVTADLVALLRDRLPPGDRGRPLVEIKRPFWRIQEPDAKIVASR